MTKLNLCCGSNVFPGWLNVDRTDLEQDYLRHLREAPPGFVWPPDQQRVADALLAGQLEFMRHDVRKGLPWPDGSVDAIYIGQAIEHFNRGTEAPQLLKECWRVLKSGAVIRLTTPSLGGLVASFIESIIESNEGRPGMRVFAREQPAFYANALPEDQLSYLMFGAMGPDCTAEDYEGHFHLYTRRSLAALLLECGYAAVITESNQPDRRFSDTLDKGMSHSFAIEAVKP